MDTPPSPPPLSRDDTYSELAERQRDELTVLEAMYPDAIVMEETEICITDGRVAGISFEVRSDRTVLRVSLPACYPLEPPQLSLSCPFPPAVREQNRPRRRLPLPPWPTQLSPRHE